MSWRDFMKLNRAMILQFMIGLGHEGSVFGLQDSSQYDRSLPDSSEASMADELLTKDSNPLASVSSVEQLPQSAVDWQHAHSPQNLRWIFYLGDQGGGPVRYNTQFPEVKKSGKPISYYHGAAFLGAEVQYSLSTGSILLGGVLRRDVWHRDMEGRRVTLDGDSLRVSRFVYSDSAVLLGWVFGRRYREERWTSDATLVYDVGSIKTEFFNETSEQSLRSETTLQALSMRFRLHVWLFSGASFMFGLGPEFHAPLYQRSSAEGHQATKELMSDRLQFKSAAAVGLSLVTALVK